MDPELQEIRSLLREVETESQENLSQQKLTNIAIDILQILGYRREQVFLDLVVEAPRRGKQVHDIESVHLDALVAKTVTSPPHIVIKSIFSDEGVIEKKDEPQLGSKGHLTIAETTATVGANYTVVISNAYLAIQEGPVYHAYRDPLNGFPRRYHVFPYSELNTQQLEKIRNLLEPPAELPSGRHSQFPASHHPHQTRLTRWLFADSELAPEYRAEIESQFFNLDIQEYSEILYEAYTAQENHEKGDALEEVAAYLFDNLTMVTVRDQNLRTKTGEIDLVLEYTGSDSVDLFGYQSRYVLIECKNTKDPVAAEQIGYFRSKLSRRNISLGIFISWSGVTGEDQDRDGSRLANQSSAEEPSVVVITSRDLYRILDGTSLYDIIDENLYQSRFDL